MKWVPNHWTTVSTDFFFFKKRDCMISSLFIIMLLPSTDEMQLALLWRRLAHRLSLSTSLLNSGLQSPGRSNSTYLWNVILASSSVTNSTFEPPLTATSLRRPLCFVPADKKIIHWLFFKTSLQRPPLYKGHCFSARRAKNPYFDSCLKPLYNGHFLLSPRWPL